MIRFATIVASILALSWCAPDAPRTIERFTGSYVQAFEKHVFIPSGNRGTWWAVLEPTARKAMDAARGPDLPISEPIYCDVEGILSPPGSYGHLNQYPREITIVRVVSASRPE